MSLGLWDEFEKRVAKHRPNPEPIVPDTGWKMCLDFPDLSRASAISFDVETYDPELDVHGAGFARGSGHIIGVALGCEGWKQYFPLRHREGRNHDDPAKVIRYISDQLRRPNQLKIGHNLAYDLGWLMSEGVEINGTLFDTWIAEKLLTVCTSRRNQTSLDAAAEKHLGLHKESETLYDWQWEKFGRGKRKGEQRVLAMQNLRDAPPVLVGPYAESDVDLPIEIAAKQWKLLELSLIHI